MEINVLLNKKGLSLISVLVAMAVFLISMLGLLSGIIYSRNLSTRNLLRNEAVRIVQEVFNKYRNESNTKINADFKNTAATSCSNCLDNSSVSGCHLVIRQIHNTEKTFAMLFRGASTVVAGRFVNKDNITICWKYRGILYSRSFSTVILK